MSIYGNLMKKTCDVVIVEYQVRIRKLQEKCDISFIKREADANKLEQLLTDHGYKIIEQLSCSATIYGNEPDIEQFDIVIQKCNNDGAPKIKLNYKISTSKYHKDCLYFSIKRTPARGKKDTAKFYQESALSQSPFIQVFADTQKEIIDIFFSILDAVNDIRTKEDYNKFINYSSAVVKENLVLIRAVDKL